MKAHQATYPITTLCRVLDVSTSGYYAWCHRPVSARTQTDEKLTEHIRVFYHRSDSTYLAVVIDAFSRRVVGWSMASHLKTELVLDALNMALWNRRPDQIIHHSDQGSQYTSYAFGQRCRKMGVRPSVGSVGDWFDNAMCESFFATLECELLDRRSFPNYKAPKAR